MAKGKDWLVAAFVLLLGPREIDALVAYVASLGSGPGVPRPHPERGDLSDGQRLFADR